jgi:polyhydroxyalkanoate synthesis repressor PhaR
MSTEPQDNAPQNEAGAPKASKVIKRYSNRKLYDTERSKYVTLDEIARMIKAGEEVTIIDNETKEDLTSVTLTQIIYEEEKRESRMPLSMLRNLIQTGGTTLTELYDRSIKSPVAGMRDQVEKSVEKSVEELNKLRDAATRSVTELTDSARKLFSREERKAEEFKKACTVLLDHLEERLTDRAADIQATLADLDGTGPTEPGQPPNGPAEPAVRTEATQNLAIDAHVEMLRERVKSLESKIDALAKLQPK